MEALAPSPWPSSSFLVLVLATLLFVAAFLWLRRRRADHRRKYNIPPGPRPWPVIGNLNLIGALPHRSIRDLSRRYGPLMSLRFGSFPVVVGSSVDMARYFLRSNDLAFLDRPRTAAGRYTVYNYSGVLWSHYGEYWRQARRLWVTELLSARRLASTEHVRAEEVRAMLRGLRRRAGAGTAVVLKEHMLMVTLNVISRMVFGKKYIVEEGEGGEGSSPTTAEEFRWMIEEIFFLNGVFNIGDMVPWLGWLDPQGYIGRMKRLGGMFDRFLEHILDEHVERRRREGDGFAARDMVDLLLQFADDPSLKVPIQRDGVKAFILELITGSTDTTSVSVEWAMSEVLRNPSVLARATDELDRVVGRRRLVAEGDIPNLPYLDAVVKESMRLHPVVPLLVPRVSREDAFSVSVAGAAASYDIPAGTRVLVNVWAIGRDPAVWGDDAEEFRPERFAGGGGERGGVDVKGQDFELLPFGSGRRMCPGLGLGLRMVHLTLANLLHGFAWRLPGGAAAAEELSMEEKFGISVSRLVQLKAIPEPKLPAHLIIVARSVFEPSRHLPSRRLPSVSPPPHLLASPPPAATNPRRARRPCRRLPSHQIWRRRGLLPAGEPTTASPPRACRRPLWPRLPPTLPATDASPPAGSGGGEGTVATTASAGE